MINQPGGTDLSKEHVSGEFIGPFMKIFDALEDYHIALGYPKRNADLKTKLAQHREFCVALHAEVTELLDAVPWKPWRPDDYKEVDRVNIAEEAVDIIFFLGSILENWGVSPDAVAEVFERKMIENRRRLEIGYNEVKK